MLTTVPLVWASSTYDFRKLPLDEIISEVFHSFKTLFDYAVGKKAEVFEAEFVKYFALKKDGQELSGL